MQTDETTTEQPVPAAYGRIPRVPWNPWLGVAAVLAIYYVSQFVGGILVSTYPWLRGWSNDQANAWLNNSIPAQFVYVLLAEAFTIGAIYAFLRYFRVNFRIIGLVKPRWRDLLIGLAAAGVYYIIYLVSVPIISHFIPSLNVNQTQNIGFTSVHGTAQLVMTFISLVILPPFTEEIMVRGMLYSSLRKGTPRIAAALLTSLLFASAHLPEGGAAGPLYIAAIDTFILSMVLVGLRELTGSLWPGMTTHAIKNGIAFLALFVLSVH